MANTLSYAEMAAMAKAVHNTMGFPILRSRLEGASTTPKPPTTTKPPATPPPQWSFTPNPLDQAPTAPPSPVPDQGGNPWLRVPGPPPPSPPIQGPPPGGGGSYSMPYGIGGINAAQWGQSFQDNYGMDMQQMWEQWQQWLQQNGLGNAGPT
jgi:hypothetical protein